MRAHCGLMGHVHLECGSGEFAEEEELQYGTWMVADDMTWRSGTPRFRTNVQDGRPDGRKAAGESGGRTAGRFAGRGRGGSARGGGRVPVWREKEHTDASQSSGSRKRPSIDAGLHGSQEEELNDTATSPLLL